MASNEIGTRLRQLRGDRTLEEVATAVNISTSALGMYEQGRRIPRDDVKVALARYYGVSVEALFYAPGVHES